MSRQAAAFQPGYQPLLGGALLYVSAQGHAVTYCVRSCVPVLAGVRALQAGAHSWGVNSERQMPPGIRRVSLQKRFSAGHALPPPLPPSLPPPPPLRRNNKTSEMCAPRKRNLGTLWSGHRALVSQRLFQAERRAVFTHRPRRRDAWGTQFSSRAGDF